ncbi:MAG: gamma-glutamyl-gamma-aminobutyrate hydrolase family protein [Cytophagaceae bacterium]
MFKFNRPAIGITGPDKGGTAAWIFTALSVWFSGGRPIRITPRRSRTAKGLKALIIGGGADVDPNTYEKEHFMEEYLDSTIRNKRISLWLRIKSFFQLLSFPVLFLIRRLFSRKSHKLDKDRDELEFNLLEQAVELGIPVLGICRGAQLINIYFKGSLHKEIEPFYLEEPNRASIFPVKEVRIDQTSKLGIILNVGKSKVNALHHQAVKEPGQSIRVTAVEDNGIVQAIETNDKRFIIGVQWHPEYLLSHKIHRRIFRALASHAQNKHIGSEYDFERVAVQNRNKNGMENKEDKKVTMPDTPVPPQRQMPLERHDSEKNNDLYQNASQSREKGK